MLKFHFFIDGTNYPNWTSPEPMSNTKIARNGKAPRTENTPYCLVTSVLINTFSSLFNRLLKVKCNIEHRSTCFLFFLNLVHDKKINKNAPWPTLVQCTSDKQIMLHISFLS